MKKIIVLLVVFLCLPVFACENALVGKTIYWETTQNQAKITRGHHFQGKWIYRWEGVIQKIYLGEQNTYFLLLMPDDSFKTINSRYTYATKHSDDYINGWYCTEHNLSFTRDVEGKCCKGCYP
jgi:hypothetical protein